MEAENPNNLSECVDLHTHSTASDGTVSPEDLPELATRIGLRAIALTDHDTVTGLPKFLMAAEKFPELEAIPGIELSTRFSERELHFVGLFIDWTNRTLLEFIEEQRRNRDARNARIFEKLKSLGYELSLDLPEFQKRSEDSSIGRPHFALALMRMYGFRDTRTVFEKLLGAGKPAYVVRDLPSPERALAVIKAAGGVAVWAHPVYRQRAERAWLCRVVRKFSPYGLDAMEAYYSMFGPDETALVREVAATYDLALSGGSDFHGEASSGISLGFGAGKLRVPAELLADLRARRD